VLGAPTGTNSVPTARDGARASGILPGSLISRHVVRARAAGAGEPRYADAMSNLRYLVLPHDDLVALAASLTGLVGIPAAVLAFFLDRALRQRSTVGGVGFGTALAVVLVSAYALAIDLAAWWAWSTVTKPKVTLAAGIDHRAAYAIAFGPMALFAVVSGLWALWRLIVRGYRAAASSPA
jgi:hypothetical protein